MSISDGFGEADHQWEQWEPFVVSYSRWVCLDLSRVEDVAQEGRVALWRAFKDGHPYPVEVAKSRMKQMSWYPHKNPPTGSVHEGNRYEPTGSYSIHAPEEGGQDALTLFLGMVDQLGAVEIAYHRGEIMAALQSLTPKQRAYVYARFWCGMDTVAGSRNEGLRLAKEMNPQVNDRSGVLWSGNKTTTGARERLAEALSHLEGLVRS